jgi:hypothetical protein
MFASSSTAGTCYHKEKHYVDRPVEITGVIVSG